MPYYFLLKIIKSYNVKFAIKNYSQNKKSLSTKFVYKLNHTNLKYLLAEKAL